MCQPSESGIEDGSIYRKTKVPLLRAEFIVLYNGTDVAKRGDKWAQRLSDMYTDPVPAGQEATLELAVTVYNINKGHNKDILRHSPTLGGYETFIEAVREYEKTMPLKKAIKKAVIECIDKNILKKILIQHKTEVTDMLFEEWNMDTALKVWEEEGREAGIRDVVRRMKDRGKAIEEIIPDCPLDIIFT